MNRLTRVPLRVVALSLPDFALKGIRDLRIFLFVVHHVRETRLAVKNGAGLAATEIKSRRMAHSKYILRSCRVDMSSRGNAARRDINSKREIDFQSREECCNARNIKYWRSRVNSN